jgi:hypothetical protein
VLQYSFVDDRGNVVMSAFASSPSPVGLTCGEPPEDLPVEPLDPEELEYLISRVCAGACLVGYGRVLQGGLLPAAAPYRCAGSSPHARAAGACSRFDRLKTSPAPLCWHHYCMCPISTEDQGYPLRVYTYQYFVPIPGRR